MVLGAVGRRGGAGEQVVIEEVAHGEIRQIFHLCKLQRGIGIALGERRLEDLLAQAFRAIDQRVERDFERFEAERALEVERRARGAAQKLIQRGLVVQDVGLVLKLQLPGRGKVELGAYEISL